MDASEKTPWLRLAILAAVAIAIAWIWDHWSLWPLKVVVVLFHELGHAIAAWATGGEVLEIGLSPREGGYALTRGGWRIGILNAGYLGSLIAGMAALFASRTSIGARAATVALAVTMLIVPIALMPLLSFGQLFTFGAGVVALILGGVLPGIALRWGLRALGVFSVLYAAHDVWSDILLAALRPGATDLPSDAAQLAALTGVPAVAWGVGWLAIGLTLLVVARRWLA
jgi:hypothetical protein